jgi:hypothetical protein
MEGMSASEERAAEEEEEEEMAESVRLRTGLVESLRTAGTGRVATERVEETEVRRCEDVASCGADNMGVALETEGGVGTAAGCALRGGEEEICAGATSDMTVRGANGMGRGVVWPYDCPRISG